MPIRFKSLSRLLLVACPVVILGAVELKGENWGEYYFCENARLIYQQCIRESHVCEEEGGEGCTAAFMECRLNSGSDRCE